MTIMIIGMLVGVAILILGILIGRFWGRAVEAVKRKEISDPKPICGCGHHYSMHNADGFCHEVLDYHWENKKYVEEKCTCQRYSGPEPLPTYTSELEP